MSLIRSSRELLLGFPLDDGEQILSLRKIAAESRSPTPIKRKHNGKRIISIGSLESSFYYRIMVSLVDRVVTLNGRSSVFGGFGFNRAFVGRNSVEYFLGIAEGETFLNHEEDNLT